MLELAKAQELGVEITDLNLAELRAADEIFLTNAVTGIRPVCEIRGEGAWPAGELTRRLQAGLQAGLDAA